MSGNRTKVLTPVTTKRALKLKAVKAKLKILYLVNSSKIRLKLQYLFNLTVMVNFKRLMKF